MSANLPPLNDATKIIPDFATDGWKNQCTQAQFPAIEQDLAENYTKVFAGKEPVEKLYMATAGATDSGKTWLLERELKSGNDPRYPQMAYIDPDNLPSLTHLDALLPENTTAKDRYYAIRPGTNIIANTLMNHAVAQGCHIAHGTTLTGKASGSFLEGLGKAGYTKRLLLCGAPDEARIAMDEHRQASGDFHVTPEDFTEKANGFARNMAVYFQQGDDVRVYWKEGAVTNDPILAATYKDGVCEVKNQNALDKFTAHYEQKRHGIQAKGETLPSWEDIQAAYQERYKWRNKVSESLNINSPGRTLQ